MLAAQEPLALPTILIVDDDSSWRRSVATALQAMGHRVLTAPDGLEALDQLARQPDLMLLDLVMPWIDGVKLLNEIRKASVPWCPVIVVSADTSDATRAMLADFGVDTVVGKDGLLAESLAERVRIALASATRNGELASV